MIKPVTVDYYFCDKCGVKLLPVDTVKAGNGTGIFIGRYGTLCLKCYYDEMNRPIPDWMADMFSELEQEEK